MITCAVGLAAAFCQLGMLIPARRFVFSPSDGIYTHFPTESGDTVDKGRLGEECARLNAIFESCTDQSIVLLDESLPPQAPMKRPISLRKCCLICKNRLPYAFLYPFARACGARRRIKRGGSRLRRLKTGYPDSKK